MSPLLGGGISGTGGGIDYNTWSLKKYGGIYFRRPFGGRSLLIFQFLGEVFTDFSVLVGGFYGFFFI